MPAKHIAYPLSLGLLIWPTLAGAQTSGPTPLQLDRAVRLGMVGTAGPLCGLRDAKWAADLWNAELRAMGAQSGPVDRDSRNRDPGNRDPGIPDPGVPDPGNRDVANRAGAALSYAEDEALESFAEAAPEVTCVPLATNPDLAKADEMVAAYRAGSSQPVW